jgi:hypothetical protein
MKEKIMNFVKNKFLNPLYFDRNPEEKFIFLRVLNIIAIILTILFFKQFFLLSFFCLYFGRKLLLSPSSINMEKPIAIFISALGLLMQTIFIFFLIFRAQNGIMLTFISSLLSLFFLVLINLRNPILNPQKFINKDFLISISQFFALAFFYIFFTQLFITEDEFLPTISLITINLFLITALNILKQNLSTILEIFCFIILFTILSILVAVDFKYLLISHQNYFAITIMIINSIGLIVLFLRNKNYLKIAKILLMLILTISFFFDKEPSIRIFYFLASLGLISFIILDKKLNPIITLFTYYIFITISSIMFLFSIFVSDLGNRSLEPTMAMSLLNILILLILIIIHKINFASAPFTNTF